jgi:hypothetical protein
MKYLRRTLPEWLLFSLFLFSLDASAQSSTNSPYSRFGIGDIQSQSFVRQKGMGGTGIGYSSLYNINLNNPASLTSLYLTTFEIGVSGNYTQYQTSGRDQTSGGASFNYFSLGFPIKYKKWGTAFGLLPFSNTGYNIYGYNTDNDVLQKHTYTGSGGINQFFLANAWSPVKGVSLGLNTSYLFGTITEDRRVEFSDATYLNTRVTDGANYGDFYFSGGLLLTKDSLKTESSDSVVYYEKRLRSVGDSITVYRNWVNRSMNDSTHTADPGLAAILHALETEQAVLHTQKQGVKERKKRGDWSVALGLTSSLNSNIRASQDRLSESYQTIGGIIYADSLEYINSKSGVVRFPFCYGLGLTLKKGSQWMFQTDFSAQNWEDFSKFGEKDSLQNSWNLAAGAQYTPKGRTVKSYLSKMQYRVGFRYGESYLQLRDNRITEYAVSIGLGLPMRTFSAVHLFGEVGSRGTLDNSLIREKFIRFGVGMTLNDRWFVKTPFQ